MKIAVYHNLPGGGAKRALYEHVKELATKNEVDLYYLSTNSESFLDLRPVVRAAFVYPFFQLHRRRIWPVIIWIAFWIERFFFKRTAKRIAADMDSRAYDFVYIHQCEFTHIPPLTRYLTTPTIVYCQEPWRKMYESKLYIHSTIDRHDSEPAPIRLTRLFECLQWPWVMLAKRNDRLNAKGATMILANSYYSREYIHKAYGRYAEVDYLGVDTRLFRNLGVTPQHFVLAVGALGAEKGYDFIIQSLARIPDAVRPSLTIVADRSSCSSLETYLQSIADQLNVAICFRTNVSDDELVQLYNQALALVYAPIMEPFGLTAIEAMACGTPVVGVREGGLRETINDGVNGLLTDRDEEAFALSITKIVTDTSLRDSLSKQCRKSVERFSWGRSVDRLLELSKRLQKITDGMNNWH